MTRLVCDRPAGNERRNSNPTVAALLQGLWLGTLVLAGSGCPVDSRDLVVSDGTGVGGARVSGGYSTGAAAEAGSDTSAEAGSGSASAGGRGSGGTNSSGGLLGDAGSAGEGGAGIVDGCSDLDGNHIGDCAETLAQNPNFSENGLKWKPETDDVAVSWKAEQDPQLGLLSVKNTRVENIEAVSMGGSLQCIPAQGDLTYLVYSRLFIPNGQGTGLGGIGLLFYDSTDCSGNPTYGFTSTLLTEVGSWLASDGNGQAPSTTRSMAVRLVSVKPFRQNSFDVWFDDVLVRRY